MPTTRENLARPIRQISEMILRQIMDSKERWEQTRDRMRKSGVDLPKGVSYEGMKEFVGRGEYRIEPSQNWHMNMMLFVVDNLAVLLSRRNWTLLTAREGEGDLICSDHPVSLVWSDGRSRGFFAPGFGLRGTDVTFQPSASSVIPGSGTAIVSACLPSRSTTFD